MTADSKCPSCGKDRYGRICIPCFHAALDRREVRARDLLGLLHHLCTRVLGPEKPKNLARAILTAIDPMIQVEDAKEKERQRFRFLDGSRSSSAPSDPKSGTAGE